MNIYHCIAVILTFPRRKSFRKIFFVLHFLSPRAQIFSVLIKKKLVNVRGQRVNEKNEHLKWTRSSGNFQ